MKVSVAFTDKKFLFKIKNPEQLITYFEDSVSNQINKEFPNQYLIKNVAYSIHNQKQTFSFSCKTNSKEIENKSHFEEMKKFFTQEHFQKFFNKDSHYEVNIIPTHKIVAIETIARNTVKIDPFFADYCARHLDRSGDLEQNSGKIRAISILLVYSHNSQNGLSISP